MRDHSGHATGSPPKFTPLRFVNFGGDPKNSFFLRKLCKVILTKSDGKLYVSAVFDCFDASVLGIAMADNMRAELCVQTVQNACKSYREMRGAVIHSDRGSQYTSEKYRSILTHFGIIQSMNSAGGRCHDNARCESMWARMKEELFYLRGRRPENYVIDELKTLVWRYLMSYWNNRRICTAIGGVPPAVKRRNYYAALSAIA